MPVNTNYFKIGVFVLAALVLFVAGVVVFGLSTSLQPKIRCETFFDRSVQGLSAGSAVKFRGFKVGQVDSIDLSRLSDAKGKQMVRVRFYIDPTILVGGEGEDAEAQGKKFIEGEAHDGLRVYLTFQGVTGVGFLDLDYNTEEPKGVYPAPRLDDRDPNMIYIPNSPSRVMEIGESATAIVKSLSTVDFSGISTDLKTLVVRVDGLVARFEQEDVAKATVGTLNEIKSAAQDIAALAKGMEKVVDGSAVQEVSKELAGTAAQLRSTLKRTDQLLSSPQTSLPATLENLRAMSENLRELSELLKKYPSLALFGQEPPEVKPNVKNKR